jgi:DnaJ like chaperone protein
MVSLIVLTAAVMKADGKVTRGELDFVKQNLLRAFGQEAAPMVCACCAMC